MKHSAFQGVLEKGKLCSIVTSLYFLLLKEKIKSQVGAVQQPGKFVSGSNGSERQIEYRCRLHVPFGFVPV